MLMIEQPIYVDILCPLCRDMYTVLLYSSDFDRWQHGDIPILEAMPYLDPSLESFFLTGVCNICLYRRENEET